MRATSSHAHADDITQQVFVKAWSGHARFDPHLRPLPAWLVGIARHTLADHAASQARELRLADRWAQDNNVEHDGYAEAVVDTVVVSEGLASVNQPRRHILELAYFTGLTHSQIAEKLELPLGTVKSHVIRGLIELRDMVEVTNETS